MTVTQVVNPNSLDARFPAPAIHLMPQKILREREQTIRFLKAVALAHILLQAVAEGVRNCDHTVAFRRLRRRDDILAFDALIGFVDGNPLLST